MLDNLRLVVTVPVVDVKRAQGFYGETLGLKAVSPTAGNVAYECGGTLLSLYQRRATTADHTIAGFETTDLDEFNRVLDELKARGVTLEEYDMQGIKTVDGVATLGDAKAAWFKDTEGNILAVAYHKG